MIGYTTGAFDLFHIGHLNLLRNAKAMCDILIVGVSTNQLVKNKNIIIPYTQRTEIVRNIKYVDLVVPQKSYDKYEAWKRLHYDILFVGDDWYNNEKWNEYEQKLYKHGVKIIYFPYTEKISSTTIRKLLKNVKK